MAPDGKLTIRYEAPLDPWVNDPAFPIEDWRAEVANGDTRCGYWEWVAAKREEGDLPEAEQTTVSVIACGYEWDCPHCGQTNREIQYTETVICQHCRRKYTTHLPEHAY